MDGAQGALQVMRQRVSAATRRSESASQREQQFKNQDFVAARSSLSLAMTGKASAM